MMHPDVSPTTPLRLATAAKLAFPDGTMTVTGLRVERDRGRLVVEMIAGKEYTTLAHIEEMRRLCRVKPKAPASMPKQEKAAKPSGSSETARRESELAALMRIGQVRKKPLGDTSPKNTNLPSQVVTLPLRT
jgi:hypothetical protein